MWAMEQCEPAWGPPAQPSMGTEASMGVLALKVEKGHRVQTGLERVRHTGLSLAQSLRPSPPQQATRQREQYVGSPALGRSLLYLGSLLGG